MKKNYKRFLSLLLSLVMVIGMLPMNTLAAEQLDLGLEVIARYSTNRLTWQGESGVTYHIERSQDNQLWEEIGTSSTGSYLDTGAGLGTQYYYRLTTDDAGTESVQGNVTGMSALRAIAVLFYEGNDDTDFDGTNREVIAEGEAATRLNALESGTIVYKATMNDVTTAQGVLGTNNNRYVGVRNSKIRHDLGGDFMGETSSADMVLGANTAGFVYDDSNGHWALCSNGKNVTSVDLDETKFGMLTGVGATTYYAGGSPEQPLLDGTINYIMILAEVLTDNELKALTGANLDFDAEERIDVRVYVDREQTIVVNGSVIPDTEGVKDIAEVTYVSKTMGRTGLDNTFSGDYFPLADCMYTFDKQNDGTWLISAEVDGTTVYVDPHAGASNTGFPNRDYKSNVTLVSSTNGAFKFYQQDEGYLHFWDTDDTKLYWDQCANDSGHTGHNLLVYRQANQDEEASTEVPGYVQVTNANNITDGGKYLLVAKANSGGYYAMKPCKATSNKYQHLCKVAGVVTELTIRGTSKGTGSIDAGKYTIDVQVLERENLEISLNYNYEGAPANGTLAAISGDPIGELPVPMRQGYTFFGWYLNGEKITSSYTVTEAVTLEADWITIDTTEKPANGTKTNGQPFPETYDNGNTILYRIPGIITLADGTVVAMADSRWTTHGDCGGLDTIVSTSKDNGKTWNYTYANYLGDNGDVYNKWSTCFIDPAIATNGETIYMIADLFPAGFSTVGWGYGAQAGSSGFNADGKLMLRDLVGDTYKVGEAGNLYVPMATSRSYDFYLDPNADGSYTIRKASDDSALENYSVDAMLNITSTDGTVNTHLFKADSPYQVYPTNYLYLTTSTDGMNWSAPQLIVAKNADEASLLIGPGTGTYDPINENIVFTAYSYPDQKTCLLWAGEDGVWHRSENATTNEWSSEASAVVLKDGTVRVFYRSASTTLCYTDYLWVDGEYIRDVENTSIPTEAIKRGSNGCMLTSVMYPELVNGKETILVATPASTEGRTNGYIYAFNVNDDGTMELIASHDITPGSNEDYAYSCLTVLTKGNKAGHLGLLWENAGASILYSVIDIHDVLKQYIHKDVALTTGKTAVFTDDEGYYVGADTSALDTDVATVEITGNIIDTATAVDEAVSAIEDGTYVIVNVRAGKPMSNGSASNSSGNGLSLGGSKNDVAKNAIWTVKAVNGGYTVQDTNGKYLTLDSNSAGLTTEESVVSIVPNGNAWTISQNGAYLNDFGGGGNCAAGYEHSSAATDNGSQWSIYTMKEVIVEGTSQVTFTGVAAGETQVQIGHVVYKITVICSHADTEVRDAKDATCTDPGYTGDTWCLDCTEKIETGAAIPAKTHAYGEPAFTWNDDNTASATVTCANDKTHVENLDVEITSETTEGHCEKPAVTVYTATVIYNDETYTSIKEVEGELGKCADAGKDHECDICGEEVGEHVAAEGSHDCAYCGKPASECTDVNPEDHNCDVCGTELSQCKDENTDYECDICGKDLPKPDPEPTDPEVTEPDPTEPDPTEPEVTEPKPTEPKPTESAPTEPEATEPEAPKVEGVTRLAGENRLVTSELIADQLKEKMGVEKFENIIVASGGTFADALPGSYLAAEKNAPILLTLAKQKYIDQTAAYIKANLVEGGTVYILGGESAVPASMEAALAGIKVQRVAGDDRFGTNLAILKAAGVKEGDEILVCTAKEFADSLSAAATGKPILLVYKKLTDAQKAYLATLSNCKFTVVGGTTAVPDSIAKEVEAYGAVTRLAGKDRLETSVLVAEKYFPDATTSVIAYGWDFPDGLCGGSLAYALDAPLILTHSKEKLAQFTADYTTKAGLKVGYVLGGDGLVDDAATRAIFGMDSESITLIK